MEAHDVAQYLKDNPQFFENYADEIAEIYVPHPHAGHAIPIAERQILALREKNVPFELKLPTGIGAGSGYGTDFTSASPRGEVPALVDGGARIFDSTIILEYIEDKWPTPPLLPREPAGRALRAHDRRCDGHALRGDQLGPRRDPLHGPREGRSRGEDRGER